MNLQVGVKVLLQNKAGEYLFMQRAAKMESEIEPHWDIPGGRIEPEESLLNGLSREISEETGINLIGMPKLLAAQDIFVNAKDLHVVRLTYSAHGEGKAVISDEHQHQAWWNRENALEQNLDPYVREVVEKII